MALEMRPICERCGAPLPHESPDARICSYECTFCTACADELARMPELQRRAAAAAAPRGRRVARQPPLASGFASISESSSKPAAA